MQNKVELQFVLDVSGSLSLFCSFLCSCMSFALLPAWLMTQPRRLVGEAVRRLISCGRD